MQWAELFSFALAYSGVFLIGFAFILGMGVLVSPGAMSQDYPPAIRERYGPKTQRDRMVSAVMSVLTTLLVFGSPMFAMAALRDSLDGTIGFLDGFVVGIFVLLALNIFDLLIVDWLVFCTIQPNRLVLPGTRGMSEYRDYSFHWKVLVPRPIPWPLLLIPAFGVYCGVIALIVR
ncbi:hypothetical protein [Millisia brevis]|uniref:hypothetical protein n=1 Tax=Millisia brevis TaxID=264148 RepID=UPI00082C42E9|nr:hypothetical protein [Millisia brevis]